MYQSDRVTRMARLAIMQGADWVLPIDADEFWVGAGGSFRHVLEDTPAEVRRALRRVGDVRPEPRRPGGATGLPRVHDDAARASGRAGGRGPRLVRDEEVGWVEIMYTPKCVHRARPGITVPKGNHLTGVPDGRATDLLTCLHAPMRAFSTLAVKLDHGRRAVEENGPLEARSVVAREALVADGAGAHAGPRVGGAQLPRWSHHRRRPAPRARLRTTGCVMPVVAVAPLVRTTAADVANPTLRMPPAVGAYYYALDTVPGWFSMLDFRILVELDRLQHEHGIGGDLFEIGAYYGKERDPPRAPGAPARGASYACATCSSTSRRSTRRASWCSTTGTRGSRSRRSWNSTSASTSSCPT